MGITGLADLELQKLLDLASLLHPKVEKAPPARKPIAVVMVGAGASATAGLPLAQGLKDAIYNEFVSDAPVSGPIHSLLAEELRDKYPETASIERLSLFQLAALFSRFEYGRKALKKAIGEQLNRATHRPLAYELLAHLAKHRYVDHFIVLNFDHLLDDALADELPERLRRIASEQDVPSRFDRASDSEACYSVRPFGQIGEGPYSVTTEDVERFGPSAIRDFIDNRLLGPTADDPEYPVLLILIGYAGAEPAFARFLEAQRYPHGVTGARRPLSIYVIDPVEQLHKWLAELGKKLELDQHLVHIRLEADCAMEVLLEALRLEWEKAGHKVWVPASRHKLISRIFTYDQLRSKHERFGIELLLQGIKSRGFVHLEAFSHVQRLAKFGDDRRSRTVIDRLLKNEILVPDEWQSGGDESEKEAYDEFVPNYMIPERSMDRVVEFFAASRGDLKDRPESEWILTPVGDRVEAVRQHVDRESYIRKRIEEIQIAPEVEVVKGAAPEVPWILGDSGVPLASMDDLTKFSERILEQALASPGTVELYGIWSTGEWLFSESGWAAELGDRLLQRRNIALKVLISSEGGVQGVRSARRKGVLEKLSSPSLATVEVRTRNWWELNRVLTLIKFDGEARAIYMRRRISRPLVCPYALEQRRSGSSGRGIRYLDEMWSQYWRRSLPYVSQGG